MSDSTHWLAVPRTFGAAHLARLKAALPLADVRFRLECIATAGVRRTQIDYLLFVDAERARAAARVLREVFEVVHPDEIRPMSGVCPSCATALTEAWRCPGCDLNFRSASSAGTPLFEWIEKYGGFEPV